jgi:predicted nucleic acid-binding protein
MTRVVVDASVAVKWIFDDPGREAHVETALALLDRIADGRIAVLQPVHWLGEVAAVAVRLDATLAPHAIRLLHAMELPVIDGVEVYDQAISLASRLGHHLFDTLYHAVALVSGETTLVTDDAAYHRRAHHLGSIVLLEDVAFP